MRTSILFLSGFMLLQAPDLLAQKSSLPGKAIQKETVILHRDLSGETTVELTENGVYLNGEQIATRSELNNRNIHKKIILRESSMHGTRSYDDYYNSGGPERNKGNRALLGVYTAANRSGEGAYIQSVTPGGAAEMAGLRAGDIITKVDTTYIYNAEDLTGIIRQYDPGDKVTIRYDRKGKERQTTATLGEAREQGWSKIFEYGDPDLSDDMPLPPPPPRVFPFEDDGSGDHKPRLGVTVEDLADGKGVRIMNVRPGSPAETGGLRPDDVITSVAGERIENVEDLQRMIGNLKPGTRITIALIRGGDRLSKTVTMPKPRNIKDL